MWRHEFRRQVKWNLFRKSLHFISYIWGNKHAQVKAWVHWVYLSGVGRISEEGFLVRKNRLPRQQSQKEWSPWLDLPHRCSQDNFGCSVKILFRTAGRRLNGEKAYPFGSSSEHRWRMLLELVSSLCIWFWIPCSPKFLANPLVKSASLEASAGKSPQKATFLRYVGAD